MSTPREEAEIQPPYHSKQTTTGWAKGQDTKQGRTSQSHFLQRS